MGEGFLKLIGSNANVRRFGLCPAPDGELHCGVRDRPGRSSTGRLLTRTRGFVDFTRAVQVVADGPCHAVLVERGHARRGYSHSLRRSDRPDRSEQRHEQWQLRYRTELRKWRRSGSACRVPNPIPMRMASRVSCSGPIPAVRRLGRLVLSTATALRFAFASAAANCERPATNGTEGATWRQLLRSSTRCWSASSIARSFS